MKAAIIAIIIALISVIAYAAPVDFNSCGGYLTVDKIEGSEWPPVKGKYFSSTTFLKNGSSVDAAFKGATWTVQSKWNGMSADSQSGTVCGDGFGNIKCDAVINKGGELQVINDGTFPSSAPSGTYVIRTEVKDSQANVLYCYTTTFKA